MADNNENSTASNESTSGPSRWKDLYEKYSPRS